MQQEEAIKQAIIRSWKDPEFKKLLLKSPEKALKQCGYNGVKGKKIYVHEQNDKEIHFVIPKPPSNIQQMDQEELGRATGGGLCGGVSAIAE